MSEWSHLANAKHIDRIIANAKANPKAWDAAWDAAWGAAFRAARYAARGAAYKVKDAAPEAWDAALDAARRMAYDAARGAILALVAWDHAGDLMDSPAEQVKVLAILGDHAALLMYPAIRAIETTQELA